MSNKRECIDTAKIVAACFACSKNAQIQNASLHTSEMTQHVTWRCTTWAYWCGSPCNIESVRNVCVATFSFFMCRGGVQDIREAFLKAFHILYLFMFEEVGHDSMRWFFNIKGLQYLTGPWRYPCWKLPWSTVSSFMMAFPSPVRTPSSYWPASMCTPIFSSRGPMWQPVPSRRPFTQLRK